MNEQKVNKLITSDLSLMQGQRFLKETWRFGVRKHLLCLTERNTVGLDQVLHSAITTEKTGKRGGKWVGR